MHPHYAPLCLSSSARRFAPPLRSQWTEAWLSRVTYPAAVYIGVSGWDGPAEFSIVATTTPYIVLESGRPQSALATPDSLAYFLLNVPPIAANGERVGFTVSTSVLTGDPAPRLYVNTVNSTAHSCAHCGWPYCASTPCVAGGVKDYNRHWSSDEALDPSVVTVEVTDPYYEPGEMYVIAVAATAARESTFVVTATLSTGVIALTDALPLAGAASAGEYAYYSLTILNPSVTLSVYVTPSAGAPEVYVSVNSTNRRPTSAWYDKRATPLDGGASLALIFTWAELPECPDSSVDHTVYCHAYIAILGGGGVNAAYDIVAEANKPNVTELRLRDGVSQVGVVAQGDYVRYYALVDLPMNTSYSVVVSPRGTAKVDIYATTDGSRPTVDHFAYSSVAVNGPEQITVSPGTQGYNSSCILRVAVHHPFVDIVGFEITYEASELSPLMPSVAVAGNTQVTQARWYMLRIASRAPALVDVALTGLSGDPLLVVGARPSGAGSDWRPTPGSADDCGAPDGARIGDGYLQAIRIHGSGPCACLGGDCTLLVGVLCRGTPYRDPTCRYSLVATAGDPAATAVGLADGVPLYDALDAAVPFRYFSFDMGGLLRDGGNASLTASWAGTAAGAPLRLVASNVRGAWPLPGKSAQWDSNVTGTPGGEAAITIHASDPYVVACPACSLLTVGVFADGMAGGLPTPPTGFLVSASTTSGDWELLSMGGPSTPVTDAFRSEQRFLVYMGVPDVDLVLDITLLAGRVVVGVDVDADRAWCTIGPPPSYNISCASTWFVRFDIESSGSGGSLRIQAADPCANANAMVPCDASTAWRPGPYFISVAVLWSPTTYIVTAVQPGAVLTLTDGVPQAASTSAKYPAILLLRAPASVPAASPPLVVRLTIAADDLALSYYIASCVPVACSPDDMAPGPSHSSVYGTVSARETVYLAIAPGDAGYCSGGSSSGCRYYVGIYPPPACPPATCSATFVIAGSAAPGDGVIVSYSAIASRVFQVAGTAPPATTLQVFLSPVQPQGVSFALDACGGGSNTVSPPAIYICDPSIPTPVGCVNPMRPSGDPGQSTTAAQTSFAKGGASTIARVDASAATMLYASVDVNRTTSSAGDALPTWEVSIFASDDTPILVAGVGNATVQNGVLLWPTAQVVVASQSGTQSLVGVNASYTVLVAPVSFAAAAALVPGIPAVTIVDETPCGLDRWVHYVVGSVAGARSVNVTVPFVALTALGVVEGLWEVAVVATCGPECWASSSVNTTVHGAGRQRVVYGAWNVSTGSTPVPPPAPGSGMSGAEITAAVLSCAAAVVATAAVIVLYRRQQAAALAARYVRLDTTPTSPIAVQRITQLRASLSSPPSALLSPNQHPPAANNALTPFSLGPAAESDRTIATSVSNTRGLGDIPRARLLAYTPPTSENL